MSVIAAPVQPAPQLYAARQVRYVDPSQNGEIHMVDGSIVNYNVTTGTPAITYVASSNAGNVVPVPGSWILSQRPALNADTSAGPGTQSVARQLQVPTAISAGNGPFLYLTNAAFVANYATGYTGGTVAGQIVP